MCVCVFLSFFLPLNSKPRMMCNWYRYRSSTIWYLYLSTLNKCVADYRVEYENEVPPPPLPLLPSPPTHTTYKATTIKAGGGDLIEILYVCVCVCVRERERERERRRERQREKFP
jgi:hypothetical protein